MSADPIGQAGVGVDAGTSAAEVSGIVFDVAHFSTHDGPGIRTVVFLKGCPLRCVWCHSPDSWRMAPELIYIEGKCIGCGRCVDACPTGARRLVDGAPHTDRDRCDDCGRCVATCPPKALQLRGRRVGAREVVEEVARDAVFFRRSGGGVTLSGGEPTLQPSFTEAILKQCRDAGISTAMETSGFAPIDVFRRLAPLVDLFLFDLKHLDSNRHRELCGQTNELILANLRYLVTSSRMMIARYPVIPGYNDDAKNLALMASLIKELEMRRVELLPYNTAAGARHRWIGRAYPLEGLQPRGPERLQDIARTLGV